MLDCPEGFEITFEGKASILETFRGPIEQILRNLIGNAVKHHDRTEGKVTVSTIDDGDFWRITVEDDGPGIAQEKYQRVFDIDRQPQAGEEIKGSGMGLPLVHRGVQEFGGEVGVDRNGGRGTAFWFTWPKQMPENALTDRGTAER